MMKARQKEITGEKLYDDPAMNLPSDMGFGDPDFLKAK